MMEKEIKSLRRWKVFSFGMFVVILCAFLANAAANFLYVPKKDIVLLEKDRRLFQIGDLTQPSISSGEVRQLVFDVINEKLEFDYVRLAKERDYQNRFTGKVNKDMPDTRDVLRVWFTPKGFAELMDELDSMPFMRNFYGGGKWVRTTVATPPKTTTGVNSEEELVGRVNGQLRRLEYMFTGRFYFEVKSRKDRDERYLISYTMKLVRDDKPTAPSSQKHFFTPMIENNYTGMKIDSISLTIGES